MLSLLTPLQHLRIFTLLRFQNGSNADIRTLLPREEKHLEFCGEKASIVFEVQHATWKRAPKAFRIALVVMASAIVVERYLTS